MISNLTAFLGCFIRSYIFIFFKDYEKEQHVIAVFNYTAIKLRPNTAEEVDAEAMLNLLCCAPL